MILIDEKTIVEILEMSYYERHNWYKTLSTIDKINAKDVVDKVARRKQAATRIATTCAQSHYGKMLPEDEILKMTQHKRSRWYKSLSIDDETKVRQLVKKDGYRRSVIKQRKRICSKETSKKISKALTGRKRKPFSHEARRNMSEAHKGERVYIG